MQLARIQSSLASSFFSSRRKTLSSSHVAGACGCAWPQRRQKPWPAPHSTSRGPPPAVVTLKGQFGLGHHAVWRSLLTKALTVASRHLACAAAGRYARKRRGGTTWRQRSAMQRVSRTFAHDSASRPSREAAHDSRPNQCPQAHASAAP